jgi:hypothetical protein
MADIEKVLDGARGVVLPFESWERLSGEGAAAYSAFCAYRDFGPERNIRRVVEASCSVDGEAGESAARGGDCSASAGQQIAASGAAKKYRVWRLWSMRHKWRERAADYDVYLDRLRLIQKRKGIEAREAAYRETAGKMLLAVNKKLDMMRPEELEQSLVTDWVKTAMGAEREVDGIAVPDNKRGRQADSGQLELRFDAEFEGL